MSDHIIRYSLAVDLILVLVIACGKKNPEKLQAASTWQKTPASFPIKPGNEYFVAVHDDNDDAASPQLFDLRLE